MPFPRPNLRESLLLSIKVLFFGANLRRNVYYAAQVGNLLYPLTGSRQNVGFPNPRRIANPRYWGCGSAAPSFIRG
jgi:hypothetical protein